MKNFIYGVIGIIIFCACIYGMYFVFKTVSYNLFYEDMVRETISEVLKKNNLIK